MEYNTIYNWIIILSFGGSKDWKMWWQVCDLLWRTKEHVAATSSSFSRNQHSRLFYLINTIRAFIAVVELPFNNLGLPSINYYKKNHSWMHYCVCIWLWPGICFQLLKFCSIECIGYIGHIDSTYCTGKIRHKCLMTCSLCCQSRSHIVTLINSHFTSDQF